MDNIKVKNTCFQVKVEVDLDKFAYVLVEAPSVPVVESIRPALATIYKLAQEGTPVEVIIADWRSLIDKGYERQLTNFFEKCALTGIVVTEEAKELRYDDWAKSVDDDIVAFYEGSLLFFCASYRYLPPARKKIILEDFLFSSTLTDLKDSLMKQLTAPVVPFTPKAQS